jgi:hypothetical protein
MHSDSNDYPYKLTEAEWKAKVNREAQGERQL